MGGYLSIPILAVAALIQATIMPELRILGGAPDLVLTLVLAYSLLFGFERGVVWAVVGGVLHDLISAVPLGTTSLALVVMVAIVGYVVGRAAPRSFFVPLLAAAAGTVIVHLVTLGVLMLTGRVLPILTTIIQTTLPAMLYNMVLMLVIYRLIGAFTQSTRARRVESIQR
ncbi:MAG: rod shape-determining protein MreD [Anaerolineae bacterium]|nr:rod shape-determining protein MreD [Anaerolineae bacterium]